MNSTSNAGRQNGYDEQDWLEAERMTAHTAKSCNPRQTWSLSDRDLGLINEADS